MRRRSGSGVAIDAFLRLTDPSMRLKLLSEYYAPEPASTAQLMTELSERLSEKGSDVEVWTSQPTYQGQEQQTLPYYQDTPGPDVFRLPSMQLDKDVLAYRALNWITYSFQVFSFLLLWKRQRNERLLALTNPPILPIVTALLGWIRGYKTILVIYDVYPDVAVELGMVSEDALVVRAWRALNRFAYRQADRIVVLDRQMKRKIKSKDGRIDPDKIQIIPNWEDPKSIQPMEKENNSFAVEHGYDQKFVILYSGNHGRHHRLKPLVEAADRIDDPQVQFVFIGDGAKKEMLRKHVREKGLSNVDFHPYQPKKRLPETLTCGDVTVVSEDPRMTGLCVSCKIYSSMAAGQAILGLSHEQSEIARIIDKADAGTNVQRPDPDRIAQVLNSFANDPERAREMGQNARAFFLNHFTLEHAVDRYQELLTSL